jgi:hypothetical protein
MKASVPGCCVQAAGKFPTRLFNGGKFMVPENTPAVQTATPSAPEVAPQNFFSRLIGVLFSPGETFKEIGRAPRLLLPIIAMMLIGSVVSYLLIERIGIQNFFKAQFDQAVTSGRMSPEDASKQLSQITTGTAATITKASFPVIGALQGLIMSLIVAGLFKLISLMMGTDNEFKPLLSVTVYAFLAVSLISSVLLVIVLFLKSPEEIDINNLIGSNLNALLTLLVGKDGLPKFIMAFARWIDIFAIWIISLLAIGYAAVSKRLKVSTAAISLGTVYVLIALLGAAYTAAFS